MAITRSSPIVRFHFQHDVTSCQQRLNLSVPFFHPECKMYDMISVQVDPNKPIGDALLDYCSEAGMGGGNEGPSTVEVMDTLSFVLANDGDRVHILDPDRIYAIDGGVSGCIGGCQVLVFYCEAIRVDHH